MQKIKELTLKIQEAVPEIIWVKCSVCGYIHPQGQYGYCNINGCQGFLNYLCEKGERPITLEDVLIAIGKTESPIPIWAMDMEGEFFDQSSFDGSPIYLDKVWQMGKPLNEQTEETINFLHNILCKK